MPKILVVFYSGDPANGVLADAVAAGAESVRFTEVDVRCVGAPSHVSASKPRRQLGSFDELVGYDAIVAGGMAADGTLGGELAAMFDAAERSPERTTYVDKVGSAFSVRSAGSGELAASAIVTRLAGLGMILVPPVAGDPGDAAASERARAMGRRVAQVAGWVGHSLAHERADGHGHVHAHGHPHAHGHGDHEHAHDHGHAHGHTHEHTYEHEHGHTHPPKAADDQSRGGGHRH